MQKAIRSLIQLALSMEIYVLLGIGMLHAWINPETNHVAKDKLGGSGMKQKQQ